MKVGETVIRHPITIYPRPYRYDEAEPMEGRIVYVHPENRYHIVEFTAGKNTFRESFSVFDLVPGDTYYDPQMCYHFDD